MTVEHIEVMVEEPSMEKALRLLLPAMTGDISFEVYPHQCKDELLQRLPQRLRGYSCWLPATWRLVVIVDRDDDDCHTLKAELEGIAAMAGLGTRTQNPTAYQLVNRIAIEELEAWYFGDWEAVRAAYPRVNRNIPAQARYRDPDGVRGGTWEAFERVVQNVGYFDGGLRKVEAARAITPHMDPARNRSRSFQVLRDVVLEMVNS